MAGVHWKRRPLQMLHQRSQNALLKTYADTALAGITSKRWHNLCRRLICLSQRILGAGKYTISYSVQLYVGTYICIYFEMLIEWQPHKSLSLTC